MKPRTFKHGDRVLDAANPKIMYRIVSFDWASNKPYGVTTLTGGWVPQKWMARDELVENLSLWTM